MKDLLPEKPIAFFRSLAIKIGANEALLISALDEILDTQYADEKPQRLGDRHEICKKLTPFWSEDVLFETLKSLENQLLIKLYSDSEQVYFIELIKQHVSLDANPDDLPLQTGPWHDNQSKHVVHQPLPIYSVPPKPIKDINTSHLSRSAPLPSFGGTAGWRRQKDEFQEILDWHESQRQRLSPMSMEWEPSEVFFETLERHAISRDFAMNCLDEFRLYWMNTERKETNWDQKFFAWVKRDWVKQQATQPANTTSHESSVGQKHENTRRDTRENRKRVTAAIMDIKDTNW